MGETGETKLKVEGEGEGVGKENERNKLLNSNDTEAVNVHITYVKCGKLLYPHVNSANQLICRVASSPKKGGSRDTQAGDKGKDICYLGSVRCLCVHMPVRCAVSRLGSRQPNIHRCEWEIVHGGKIKSFFLARIIFQPFPPFCFLVRESWEGEGTGRDRREDGFIGIFPCISLDHFSYIVCGLSVAFRIE
ncbi:hypothetical protein AVEN_30609-1 [Araneus ventricosus]|uniref:Uncharacterized protein n=1 Tax=Araneus ventricosus TaxID=182803 RepID=A0A4Y2MIA4_ARAVE|nr:hypothetical protein AVEN_30609-1 [Araneus ventricosus]